MQPYIAIAIGGILGCWARYAMTNLVQAIYGRDFPYATLSINILACFLMGFLFVETLERLTISPILRTGILTGFIGGFSTFSTFAMETLLLAEQGDAGKSVLYVILSIFFGMLATFGGTYIARNL
ncbi:fluoride efflux transporter CrcB [Rhodopila sp.]|jgi:CrcB protein|uniref:fluoride efflux transporter CrcB n=1 Tax=Rhodopila sp. TaxID=2480087 RepID=UPI002B5EF46E|nr:fluoride efflux transporter CrcB [Rhodopila sp.]HVZ06745.1 fluoride efflux transporter CrcB [Rhodopila sp.]